MIKKDDIMKIYQPDEEKMIAFGFEKLGHVYRYRKSIYDNKFYYEFVIGENQFSVEVFDAGFDEPYDLFSIGTAAGDFIMMLRNESEIIIKQIIEECFFKVDAKEKILEYIEQNFDAIKDHPFAQYPNYTVFKIPGHEK
ncbi:hypothetical protein Zmor_016311 [Zophobas morio]|uniref:Uncharacterized protein n=1 Tax=Zophobas morio TaxID=2755281 RepID=A0AA38HI98_9CUCU|nr:hypothetical protein Zmor_016311 [Zophobas morio]